MVVIVVVLLVVMVVMMVVVLVVKLDMVVIRTVMLVVVVILDWNARSRLLQVLQVGSQNAMAPDQCNANQSIAIVHLD